MKRFLKNGVALLCLLIIGPIGAYTQQADNAKPLLKKGNKLYEEQKYKEAQQQYEAAVKKNPQSFTGLHNLGDALYQTEQYAPARQAMEASTKTTTDRQQQAAAYHNIGNTYLKEKKWEEAIKAYKESLRRNPNDKDTKYNLAYANAMLKKEGGGKDNKDKNKDKQDQNQQDQKNKDKQDQENKQNENQQQDKENKDKQEKQDKEEGEQEKPQDQQEQHPQAQPSRLSQQQAENLLNALMQEEKKLQDKKNKDKGMPVKLEKDW